MTFFPLTLFVPKYSSMSQYDYHNQDNYHCSDNHDYYLDSFHESIIDSEVLNDGDTFFTTPDPFAHPDTFFYDLNGNRIPNPYATPSTNRTSLPNNPPSKPKKPQTPNVKRNYNIDSSVRRKLNY